MEWYFHFFDTHGRLLIRSFLALINFVNLVFLYAVIFDRDLPRRIATVFFGILSGQAIKMPPTDEKIHWWQWLLFISMSMGPPLLWLFFEMYAAARFG